MILESRSIRRDSLHAGNETGLVTYFWAVLYTVCTLYNSLSGQCSLRTCKFKAMCSLLNCWNQPKLISSQVNAVGRWVTEQPESSFGSFGLIFLLFPKKIARVMLIVAEGNPWPLVTVLHVQSWKGKGLKNCEKKNNNNKNTNTGVILTTVFVRCLCLWHNFCLRLPLKWLLILRLPIPLFNIIIINVSWCLDKNELYRNTYNVLCLLP